MCPRGRMASVAHRVALLPTFGILTSSNFLESIKILRHLVPFFPLAHHSWSRATPTHEAATEGSVPPSHGNNTTGLTPLGVSLASIASGGVPALCTRTTLVIQGDFIFIIS